MIIRVTDKNHIHLSTSKDTISRGLPAKPAAFTLTECADLLPAKHFGFTLAEVLITLGIIGVVAALTIPGLINNYKAHRLHSQFMKSYSTVQQVFKQMEADDVSLDPTTYGAKVYYKTFMRYLTGVSDCGSYGAECFGENIRSKYGSMKAGSNVMYGIIDDGMLLLQDGTLLMFENFGRNIYVTVDLNSYYTKPNKWGYDTFTFQLVDEQLKAMGEDGTDYTNLDRYCNPDYDDGRGGIACAVKAKNDPDYFKYVIKNFK